MNISLLEFKKLVEQKKNNKLHFRTSVASGNSPRDVILLRRIVPFGAPPPTNQIAYRHRRLGGKKNAINTKRVESINKNANYFVY